MGNSFPFVIRDVASEKSPIKVFELSFSANGLIGKQVFKKVKFENIISDLAAIGVHNDKTIFLSEEENMLLFIGEDQNEHGRIYLHKGFNGLKKSVPQAEGIFVNNTYLQICSEPNKIYIFKKQR